MVIWASQALTTNLRRDSLFLRKRVTRHDQRPATVVYGAASTVSFRRGCRLGLVADVASLFNRLT